MALPHQTALCGQGSAVSHLCADEVWHRVDYAPRWAGPCSIDVGGMKEQEGGVRKGNEASRLICWTHKLIL